MLIVPCPRQTTSRILNERYWPTIVCLEENDMDDEFQETTSYKEPGMLIQ